MTEQERENTLIELLKGDKIRVQALAQVSRLGLPQCYIAAGFVRNLVWDFLHQISSATPLNDVDVIYFAPLEAEPNRYLHYEAKLRNAMPSINWQVRNQANMHIRNNDQPYQSVLDAMSYWPEKETAVAVRQTEPEQYECISAFGLASLFNLSVSYNPKRSRQVFKQRVETKAWLTKWPNLTLVQ